MLIRRSEARGMAPRRRLAEAHAALAADGIDRRGLLRRAGLGGAGLAALGALGPARAARAAAGEGVMGVIRHDRPVQRIKSICPHCSVGCSVIAEVQEGVWVGQEPAWESPINRGTHCAKGAAVRESVAGERRLKYPLKLVGGEWHRLSWEQAIEEIGAGLLKIREAAGPDSVFWLGSAKFSNEAAYLFRKFAALWGTNSCDHQARICHSTTVAGVANVWGYGAQTNSFNDIRNSRTIIVVGGNPAEAHPISMQHLLTGREMNRANMIVVDPRFTRTAAHATDYVRIRPGTNIAFAWGLLWHVFRNGWEDREFIRRRVWGMEQIQAEVERWTPEECQRVTGIPPAQVERVARLLATEKPATVVWCMGATQHTTGTAGVRALCALLLATGNVGVDGTGANIFRGHPNVQGATDCGVDVVTTPFYYGLDENAWRHWARVWEVEYDWLVSRFASKQLMETPGIPTTRWFDAVLMPQAEIGQPSPIKGMVVFGHGGNTVTRMTDSVKGLEALEMLVVADPHPTNYAQLANRRDGTWLLPIATSMEQAGSRTASSRQLQWYDRVVDPIFESKSDYAAMLLLARRLGIAEVLFKGIRVERDEPLPEDLLREINRGALSTGYSGQSPERLKLHMANQEHFDVVTLRGRPGTPVAGEFYGLPWPCWGTPEMKHPGSAILYNTNLHVKQGGGTFRARFGVERDGQTLLAEGSFSKGSDIQDGYPEFTVAVLKRLGWYEELTGHERAVIRRIGGENEDRVSWSTDLSAGIIRVAMEHGCLPYGNAKARAVAWNLPDPVPQHREPIYTTRTDLLPPRAMMAEGGGTSRPPAGTYPALTDRRAFRMPFEYQTRQLRSFEAARDFPLILTSGRLVEYEGGGEETRSNRWLAELQQEMFVEINPADAEARGIRNGAWVLASGPEMPGGAACRMKALVTERVGRGVVFMPFHFGGWFLGENRRGFYPPGTDPIVLGESVNAITTYGYDPVTGMQETKVTLCQIRAA